MVRNEGGENKVPAAEPEWKKELERVEERNLKRAETAEEGGQKKKCLILTDSNWQNSMTPELVLSHIPKKIRGNYEVEIVVSYHLQEVINQLQKKKFEIGGKYVVIDCHSNDARDTKWGSALSPEELVQLLDELRQKLWDGGAAGVVVCTVKPTMRTDVRRHNEEIHKYLQRKKDIDGGNRCCTKVRAEHLFKDGIHLQPSYYYFLQKTYASAIMGTGTGMGIRGLSPTPTKEFVPTQVRKEQGWSISRRARKKGLKP